MPFVILAIVLIILAPLAVIWAVNTLFPALAIAYNIGTWAAVLIIGAFLRSDVTVNK